VPVSLPDQIKPPQAPHPPSRPNAISFLTMALFGLIIGLTVQELRWRFSVMVPQGSLAQAEQEFKAGEDPAALKLFSTLADKNNPVAQYWLGHMTELGLGVPRDPAKAIDLYRKAAAQNVDAAELRLGEIYLDGDLVPPDFAQAKTYLEKSAYQGNPRAAMLLGQMYRFGLGTTADPIESYAWSEVAVIEGLGFAKIEREAAFASISASDRDKGAARASVILAEIQKKPAPAKKT
jgi:TPR repeat protein